MFVMIYAKVALFGHILGGWYKITSLVDEYRDGMIKSRIYIYGEYRCGINYVYWKSKDLSL